MRENKICNKGHNKNKDNDESDLIHFYQKIAVNKSYKHKYGIFKKNNTKKEPEKVLDSVLDNNR